MPFILNLLDSGVAAGTCITLMMSATAISLPEIIMLKQIFNNRLLLLFIGYLTAAFVVSGYLLNML